MVINKLRSSVYRSEKACEVCGEVFRRVRNDKCIKCEREERKETNAFIGNEMYAKRVHIDSILQDRKLEKLISDYDFDI